MFFFSTNTNRISVQNPIAKPPEHTTTILEEIWPEYRNNAKEKHHFTQKSILRYLFFFFCCFAPNPQECIELIEKLLLNFIGLKIFSWEMCLCTSVPVYNVHIHPVLVIFWPYQKTIINDDNNSNNNNRIPLDLIRVSWLCHLLPTKLVIALRFPIERQHVPTARYQWPQVQLMVVLLLVDTMKAARLPKICNWSKRENEKKRQQKESKYTLTVRSKCIKSKKKKQNEIFLLKI